jgi:hypothetical protein
MPEVEIVINVAPYVQIRFGKAVSISGYSYRRTIWQPATAGGGAGDDDYVIPEEDYTAQKLDAFMKKWKGKSVGNGQCVKLVQAAVSVGFTDSWRAGTKIAGTNKPSLTRGTAIAVFDKKDGRYKNISGESHAAIFLRYEKQNGKDGIVVFDQWSGTGGRESFYAFKTGNTNGNYPAEDYSVIRTVRETGSMPKINKKPKNKGQKQKTKSQKPRSQSQRTKTKRRR